MSQPSRPNVRSLTSSPHRMAGMRSAYSTASAPRRLNATLSYLQGLRTPQNGHASCALSRNGSSRNGTGSWQSWPSQSWHPETGGVAEWIILPACILTFVVLRALDRAFLDRALLSMGDYQGTLWAVFWMPLLQIVTLMLCGFYVINRRSSEDDERYGLGWFSLRSKLASSQGPVPLCWILFFAFWDQLCITMKFLPIRYYMDDHMRCAIEHTVVMWTAITASIFLGSRFTQLHMGAIILSVVGAVVRVCPQLQNGTLQGPVNVWGAPEDVSTGMMASMYALFTFAVIIMAFSLCFKQKALKSLDMDLMWATFWSQNFQMIWGFLLYMIKWLPWPSPGGMVHHSPSTFKQEIYEAWTCFIGGDPTGKQHMVGQLHQCEEELPWVWFVMYLFFAFGYSLITLWLIKYLSATWTSVAVVFCHGCTDVAKQLKIFNPQGRQLMPLAGWLALVCAAMSVWLYSIEEELDSDGHFVCGVPSQKALADRMEQQSSHITVGETGPQQSMDKDESYRGQWSPSHAA